MARPLRKRQCMLSRLALETLLAKVDSKAARNAALARAYLEHGYTLTEIGRAAGQSYYQGSRGNVVIQDATPMLARNPYARNDPYARNPYARLRPLCSLRAQDERKAACRSRLF